MPPTTGVDRPENRDRRDALWPGMVGRKEGGGEMAEVTMEDVTKVYGEDVVAVKDMNLDILDGEFVVFVGYSGCGESTALGMIA